jgi:ParB family transcriptional regulator, chromosome partitioning protein
MNVRRGGLGRGLGALIPSGPIEEDDVTGARFEDVPIDSIEPNPRQPREVFDDDALAELVTSVREVGVLQPVVVREVGPGRYQLVMGERRWRACREAGLATVPAIIRETPDDALLRDALLENLHRQQLNPLEEAAAYQQLLQEFGATHDELADRIGRSRSQVSNTIRLLGLPPTVQRRVGAGVLSAGHARALLGLADAETQERFAARIVAEGLSVRATEELVATSERPAEARVRASRAPKAPALARLEASLSDLLETRVTVELGRRHGKLTVAFASLDDLRRVLRVLAPEVLTDDSLTDEGIDLTDASVSDTAGVAGTSGIAG